MQSFYALEASTVRPAFEALVAYFKAKGLVAQIESREESVDGKGRTEEARVGLRIMVGHDDQQHYPNHDYPSFTVICDKSKGKVRFHESTMSPRRGGQSGSAGEAALEDVTADLLQQKVAAVIRKAYG